MRQILVNLKRFEVSKQYGGLCPIDDPITWIEQVMAETVEWGLGQEPRVALTYLLPEGLLSAAARELARHPLSARVGIALGCQGLHWQDIAPGGNFGAFTSSLPARAAAGLGCTWAMIGHSEERRAKLQVMAALDPAVEEQGETRLRALRAVDSLVHQEILCALRVGLNVLLCIGETADERGEGTLEEQQPRIEAVLRAQLLADLAGVAGMAGDRKVVIGYEPIWAIGPGKVPPGRAYIAYVSALVGRIAREELGLAPAVVYGGGLREANAGMIASIDTIAGGLVGLTRFEGDIGFDVPNLRRIVDQYLGAGVGQATG